MFPATPPFIDCRGTRNDREESGQMNRPGTYRIPAGLEGYRIGGSVAIVGIDIIATKQASGFCHVQNSFTKPSTASREQERKTQADVKEKQETKKDSAKEDKWTEEDKEAGRKSLDQRWCR